MRDSLGAAQKLAAKIHNPDGGDVELKADFTFVGKVRPSTPVPEPGAALVFGVGIAITGTVLRRR